MHSCTSARLFPAIGQIVYESGLMGGASVSRVLEPDDVVVKLSLAELLMEPVEFCPTGRS